MRFAYDPPYPGKAGYYPEQAEVDHQALIERLVADLPDGGRCLRAPRRCSRSCRSARRRCAFARGIVRCARRAPDGRSAHGADPDYAR
jgi:hypothetical protein